MKEIFLPLILQLVFALQSIYIKKLYILNSQVFIFNVQSVYHFFCE